MQEPVKKKKIFGSIGKVLRKRSSNAKSKSKSLGDLTRAALHNDYHNQHREFNRQDSLDSFKNQSFDNSSLDQIDGVLKDEEDGSEYQASSVDGSASPENSRSSSILSNMVEELPLDEEKKSIQNEIVAPIRNTAAMVWKSGLCSYFTIFGEIVAGHGLIARDKTGTSDPYVKVKFHQKCIHKTKIIYRNLNPVWNDRFEIPVVDNVNTDLVFKVYDFDRLSHNDYMGETKVDLSELDVSQEHELELPLINKLGFEENLGSLSIKLTVVPKTTSNELELAQLLSTTKRVKQSNSKSQLYDAILSVILKEGKNLRLTDHGGLRDLFVRFKVGNDKYKSKSCKQTVNPVWKEQFDLKIFTANGPLPHLEITVWDKESGKEEFVGRASVDLSTLEPERSHFVELNLVDQPGTISMHLSLTAQNMSGCISDLNSYEVDDDFMKDLHAEFSLINTFRATKKIGWAQIKLYSACGLAVADLSGASDPFAVIELGNQRLVTPTIYKNLNPRWDKIYEMAVYDIHDVLDITVLDEDKRGAPEFLGRVKIPLLSVTTSEKCFYQLKDKRLQGPAKGYLVLSISVVFNPVRASIRTFNPREERVLDEVPRFRRQLLQKNVDRLSNLIRSIIATGEFIQSLFTWKYKTRSLFAFTIYILLVLNFDWFMLPLILFIVLLKNYTIYMLSPSRSNDDDVTSVDDDDDDDDDNDEKKKGKGKSFREKLEAINNICRLVQNNMDKVASFGERIKNTFNWSVPFLSYLLMVILLLATVVLYVIPLKYLLLAWGINKFTKRIRKPNAVPNNELLDFLSRVPSDPEVKQLRPLRTDLT